MTFEGTWQLPYSAERVYNAWVGNDTVIPPATKMDIKPEVGGHYRLHAAGDGFTATNEGTFSIVEPNVRLRYSWHWQGDEEVTDVEVRFFEQAGGCEVQLTHGVFTDPDSLARHDAGWHSYIAGLEAFLKAG